MKSELLKVTEVGEYGQFWLGAYTEVRSNCLNCLLKTDDHLKNIFRTDMMSTSLETGLGLTRMLLLSGLTGLRDSPTTSMDRTALLCRRCMTSSSPCSETTSGMTFLVISMLTIFVKILVLKKSHYVISQYKKMNKIYLI